MTTQVDAALIKLNATSDQLRREMDKAGRTVRRNSISMRRDLSGIERSMKGLNSIASTFSRSFAGAFALSGATLGIGGIGAALKSTVTEAEQAERQMFKLEQLVKSTGGTAALTAEQIDDFSRSLARNTLASTEGVRDAAGALLTFRTISGDTFKETLTLAQDLAATMGGDLKSKVVQLGKALEDPSKGLSALTESGVSFTEQEKELIKALQESGQLFEAQAEILKKVRQQVGGTGSAESGGLSGAVDTLSQNWSEFLENIGNAGPLQAAQGFIDGLNQRIETLNRLLFTSEQDRFYELSDRRKQLTDRLNSPRSGQSSRQSSAIRRELAEIETEMRSLQDRNIERMKKQREVQLKAEVEQERMRSDSIAAAAAEGEKKRQSAVSKERDKAQAKSLAEQNKYLGQLASLQDKLDPTSAATRDYLENVALLDRAWAEGLISGERYHELMNSLATDADALAEAEAKLAEDREKATQLIKGLDPGSSIRDQIIEVQRLRDLFPELSDTLADVELNLNDKWDSIGDGAVDAAEKASDAWQGFGDLASSAFEDAVLSGKSLSDTVNALGDDIQRLLFRNLVTNPLSNALQGFLSSASGGGGILSNLFGFASGGSFMVGGGGGTDSQLVAFNASPNERVTVETPAQQRSGSRSIINNFSFVLPSDSVDYRRTGEQVARYAARRMSLAQVSA